MKIQCPQYVVPDDEGFNSELDIFRRKEFGVSLSNIIKNTSGELVIALDAKWGEGKSTFIQMWKNELKNEIPVIIFDAFRNDRADDPYISISSHIYQYVKELETTEGPKLLKRTIDVAKVLFRAGTNIGMKAATAGVLNDTVLEQLKVDDDISKSISDHADRLIEQKLLSVRSDEECIEKFRNSLHKLAVDLSDSGKLVFVIDELDRCRPDYALDVLEVVKHIFSVENVVFLFSLNREQLEIAIRHRYGAEIDATQYLQKFVSLWINLPDGDLGRSNRRELYINHVLEKMDFDSTLKEADNIKWSLVQMAQHYAMSLREIERFLSVFAVLFNEIGDRKYVTLYELGIVLSAIKVKYPGVFERIAVDDIEYTEIVTKADLDDMTDSSWGDRDQQHRLRWILYVYLMPDDVKHEYLIKNEFTSASNYLFRDAVAATCRVIGSFGRYI